jgi:hypothetical protein
MKLITRKHYVVIDLEDLNDEDLLILVHNDGRVELPCEIFRPKQLSLVIEGISKAKEIIDGRRD